MPALRPTLIVMVKDPRPGKVKTRLARDLGATAAAWWYRHHAAEQVRRLRDPRWRLAVALSPDGARCWPPGADLYLPQGRGDLGQRMIGLMQRTGPMSAVVGSDILGLTRGHVAAAFGMLGRRDAVFGPAEDGGYWLFGLRHPTRLRSDALADVRWSTAHALDDSRAALPFAAALAGTLRDVDTADDLR